MVFRRAIASIGAAMLLSAIGIGTAAAQSLDTQLQTAVESQDWSNAIAIVDRLIASQGSTPELLDYRQQLIGLAGTSTSTPAAPVATLDGIPLTTISDELNQTLPLQLDQHTELISTSVSGNRLSYQGRMLELVVSDLDANQFNSRFFKDSFARIICPNPQILYVLDRGIELEYVLVDRNNQPLVTVEITPQTCQA
ncbi:MAG: hypothetical protein AAF268_00755 [Cyanobacteria bacterium P01_A01_bin.3]